MTTTDFPQDETGEVLREMQQAGIDLSVEHAVVFFQLFEKKEQAEQMLAHVQEHHPEIQVKLHPDEAPNVWDLDCTMTMVPSYDDIIKHEANLEQIAESFHGYNDGWGIEA